MRQPYEKDAAAAAVQRSWSGAFPQHDARVNDILSSTFGLGAFRAGQSEVVNATLTGRDAFVVMPAVGRYKLNAVDSWLASARLQPFSVVCDPGFKDLQSNATCNATPRAAARASLTSSRRCWTFRQGAKNKGRSRGLLQ
jgi:hypothetical protein